MSALSADGAVRAARAASAGQLGEPALDEVQPRRAGRGEVQHEARVGGQPALDRRRLVGGGVVEHEVDVEVGGDLAIERGQELLELDRAVAGVQRADDLAGGDVQRGVEARGAGALVVVGGALGRAGQHRQDRRGAIERLDLGLLIDAQHDRALGRVEIEPDDVADLVDELRVLGQLPGLLAVRLEPERPPDPQHRGLREPDLAAIDRVDQCVASLGVVSSVLTITSSTCSSVIVRGRPGGLVDQPVEPLLGKPGRHYHRPLRGPRAARRSRCSLGHRRQATRPASATPAPARSSARAHASNCARSSSVNSIETATFGGITPSCPAAQELTIRPP